MLPLLSLCLLATGGRAADAARPNILWISFEDTSRWLGFCGEKYARTPHVDELARRGVQYTNAYATAPVCSPSRFAIITARYATSYGTQRLRSDFGVPADLHGFPSFLRQAGYYCSNNVKTDYNTGAAKRFIAESWDETSVKAHWRNRQPGQPFFAVFNLVETHQSKAFEDAPPPDLEPAERHDPALAPLPPYYPDTPAARQAMARVHDCITAMDKHAGQILAELERDGLMENTIIFFWSDHGQAIPRGKRTLWDTGLKVPMIVYFPEKYRQLAPAVPGSTSDRLVSLMDLGPTVLSLLQVPIPEHLQGRAFLGRAAAAPREYVFGARDRVDEANDVSRSVRDGRYLYIRNFMPDLSWNQPEAYSDQLGLRREITRLAKEGKLNADQLTYAGPSKPAEALYDTAGDPWQVKNVAADPALRPVLERMRHALSAWQLESRDLGLIHEGQAEKMAADGRSLFEVTRTGAAYPLERVLDTAWRVGQPGETDEFIRRLNDRDPTVRYWAIIGLRIAGPAASGAAASLKQALADESATVRIEAAGIRVVQGDDREALRLLIENLTNDDGHVALHAARTLQMLGEKARPAIPALREALLRLKESPETDYARWSIIGTLNRLTGENQTILFEPPKPVPTKATAKEAR
jgi:arylsulfatase A-like enzyme